MALVLRNRIAYTLLKIGVVYVLKKLVSAYLWSRPTPPKGAAVFITGAGSGIGKATALLLNKEGFNVYAGVISGDEGLELIKESANLKQMHPIICDVTSLVSLKSARDVIEQETDGKLWGLINNAGINIAIGPVEFVPLYRVRKVLDVNVMGTYNTIQVMMPLVRAAKGRVVNTGSINGFFSLGNATPYCCSKAAINALTEGLRLEIAPLGCFASIIEPGGIKTPIWNSSMAASKQCDVEMGAESISTYGAVNVEKSVDEMTLKLSDPIVVAKAIHHAISSKTPKLRYTIGAGAGMFNFLKRRFLSDEMFFLLLLKLTTRGRNTTATAQTQS